MEDIPVPIPNTEVKLHSAESSWGIAPCEGRTLPCGGLAQLGERLPYKQRVTGSSPVSSIYESLAQSVEHLTFNQRVDSSSLSRLIVGFAGVAELADALDLGSSGRPCRFKSCCPHEKRLSLLLVSFFDYNYK